MAETSQPYVTTTLRELHRRLTGNQLKVLRAIHYLDLDGTPTTPDHIAVEAHLARATVYRCLTELHSSDLVEHRLTKQGRALVDYSLTAESAMLMAEDDSNIINRPERPPECRPKFETPVSNRDGLTANFETPVSNRDTPERGNPGITPAVNTESTKTNWLTAKLTPDEKHHATELARSSAKQLDDEHSVGLHITVWTAALTHDRINGNDRCQSQLTSLLYILRGRLKEQQRPQGAAWTKRTKQLITEWGLQLQRNREAATAPARNEELEDQARK